MSSISIMYCDKTCKAQPGDTSALLWASKHSSNVAGELDAERKAMMSQTAFISDAASLKHVNGTSKDALVA